jgi:hypothetical protein
MAKATRSEAAVAVGGQIEERRLESQGEVAVAVAVVAMIAENRPKARRWVLLAYLTSVMQALSLVSKEAGAVKPLL